MNKLMKSSIIRSILHALTLSVIILASITISQAAHQYTSISNWIITPVLAVFIVGAYAWGVRCIYRGTKASVRLKEQVATQAEALNEHSLVTKTDENNCLTYVNDKFVEATGYSRGDLLGQSSSTYWPNEDDALLHEVRSTLRKGENWTGEVRIITKNDKIIYTHTTYVPEMDKNGNLRGNLAIRTDITKHKVATGDKNTRRSLHILRDEIYMFEAGTLRYIFLNQAAMDRCGWDEDTYPRKTILERDVKFDNEDTYNIKAFYERARPLINDDVEEITHEMDIDGVPSEVKMQLVRPDVGKPYFMSIVRDISERSAFDKAKDNFISTVSHELRTPVTSIKGALGLILSGSFGEMSDKAQGMLDIAYRNTDRLGLLINDILDLEKIAAGRMEFHMDSVDMCELIEDAIVENEPYSTRYDVSMVSKGQKEGLMCYCDKDRVFQVMNNLLSNAAKFSHKGGEVIINLEERENTIYISVEDFGAGIPCDAKATIFDRFTQADSSDRRAKGGTGLGLSIVKTLIEQQGGKINFSSKWGEGTKFFFELPKAQADAIDETLDTSSIAAE